MSPLLCVGDRPRFRHAAPTGRGRSLRRLIGLSGRSAPPGTRPRAALQARACHEAGHRGRYGGAVFRGSSVGGLDVALVLRTLIGTGDDAWLRAGAGVTAQSDPERETDEACEKHRSVAPPPPVHGGRSVRRWTTVGRLTSAEHRGAGPCRIPGNDDNFCSIVGFSLWNLEG
ncbi:chorismate-binding protein [Streptomyces sp. NPDC090126]|uniref:chorismate-binding protein n=1 Tax=Streptomyces sp. NPDC090126 TaxID=3365952 RepID=UPI003827610B